MSEPFDAYELVRRIAGPNVEADAIRETNDTEQRVLAEMTSRGHGPSASWVIKVATAMKELIEAREQKVMDALKRALWAKPPPVVDDATPIQIANFVMEDLGRYYNHSSSHIYRVAKLAGYIDGIPNDLSEHQKRLRERVTGEIEIILAEIKRSAVAHPAVIVAPKNHNQIFVVHGRNDELRKDVVAAIKSFGLEAVVLHEQPNKGRTIIEKFEDHSNVGFAVVIMSGDDVARLKSDDAAKLTPRPRQNVVLEFGFFLGRLGRKNVCALYEDGVDLPSDYDGVLWVRLDAGGLWVNEVRREIAAAGLLAAE